MSTTPTSPQGGQAQPGRPGGDDRHPDAYPYGEPWGPDNPAPCSPWSRTTDRIEQMLAIAVQHHLVTSPADRPPLDPPPPGVTGVHAEAAGMLDTYVRVETDTGTRHFLVRVAAFDPESPPDHDCPKESFLDDPMTRAYGVGGEMVDLIACPVCDAGEAK